MPSEYCQRLLAFRIYNAVRFLSFQWIRQPARPNDKRNLYGDLACFALLTPLAGVSSWLCLSGAIHYSKFEKTKWETAGLITLAVFLILIYAIWCMVSSSQAHVMGFPVVSVSGVTCPDLSLCVSL